MNRLLAILRRLVDPRGPLGEVVSPSEVYKTRLGLPISSPHTMHATVTAPKAEVEKTLSPSRFVTMEEAGEVPKDRVRQVSAFVEEHWSPVYQSTQSTDMWEIIQASKTQIGWKVTQHQTMASRPRLNAEEFIEVAQSCQIQASDEFYNGVYPTIPGNDPIIMDGKILRGAPTYNKDGSIKHDGIIRGTMITRGRGEYEQRTKGFTHWDKAFAQERIQAQAEYDSRPVRNLKQNLERVAGEALPMRRLVANPRYDRQSAV